MFERVQGVVDISVVYYSGPLPFFVLAVLSAVDTESLLESIAGAHKAPLVNDWRYENCENSVIYSKVIYTKASHAK